MNKTIPLVLISFYAVACESTQPYDIGSVIQKTTSEECTTCQNCLPKSGGASMAGFGVLEDVEKNTQKKEPTSPRKQSRNEPFQQDYPPAPHTTPTTQAQDLKEKVNEPFDQNDQILE
ncbi:MAG: hypothetical protein NEHIOOID_00327 [Holosporales bacterium]